MERTPLPPHLTKVPFHVDAGAEASLTDKRMRGRDLTTPFPGVRMVAEASIGGGDGASLLARCLAYSTRQSAGQVFSHATAARLWGVPLPAWLQSDPRLHVSTVDGANRPRLIGVVGHELTDPALRIVTRLGVRVLDPATVWLQLAARLPLDDLIAAADHLVLTPRRADLSDPRPYVALDRLSDRVRRFRGRGRRNALIAIGQARDGAESPRETLLRLSLIRHGLPEPALNLPLLDARGGRIGFGDHVYPEFRVVVEYDGEQHRTDSKQFLHDIERHEALVRADWLHLRETKETPRSGPRSTPWRTERALRVRGWRP